MLKIQEHLLKHGLEATIDKFKLDYKDLGHKVMFKYNQLNSSNVHTEVKECRGLILRKSDWRVISMPFTRFYNYGDHYAAKLDVSKTVFTEKRDGTLIQIYRDFITDKWCINTMFSEAKEFFNGTDISFRELFLNISSVYGFSFSRLDWDTTYIFELTSIYNKVVVNYDKADLRLIGARYIGRLGNDLREHTFGELKDIAKHIKIPIVETYNFSSFEECIESFKGTSFNFEGYVAFDGKDRVKIKNPSYVAIHLTKRQQGDFLDLSNPHIFLDLVKQNEIDEFKVYFPDATELINDLYTKYHSLLQTLKDAQIEIGEPIDFSPLAKKNFATKIQEVLKERKIKPELSAVFFMLNSNKIFSIEEYLENYDNKKLIKLL